MEYINSTKARMPAVVLCLAILAALILPASIFAQEKPVKVVMGGGFIISPDYYDAIRDAYPSPRYTVAGGYGWLDFQLGVRFRLINRLSITPAADFLFNFMTGDVSAFNTILLPSASLRYAFVEGSSFYLRGEVNYGMSNIQALKKQRWPSDVEGFGFGAAIGYCIDGITDIELGYLYVPIEIGRETKNFGGISLKISAAF